MSARQVIATVWEFASESSPGKTYQTIQYTDGSTSCECPGWRFKRKVAAGGARTCKHVRFVDMGTADAHATGRKDYERVQGQPAPARMPMEKAQPELARRATQTRRVFEFD